MLYQLSYTPTAACWLGRCRCERKGVRIAPPAAMALDGAMRRIEKWLGSRDIVKAALAAALAGYVRLCFRTARMTRRGLDRASALMAQGPVIVVTWHSRLPYGSLLMPAGGKVMILRVDSDDGDLSERIQKRLGTRPVLMRRRAGNMASSRMILREIRKGWSLGLTGDGPAGPARVLNPVATEWARITGLPVIALACSSRPHFRLRTWDRLMMPLPFARAAAVAEVWEHGLDRRSDPEAIAAARAELSDLLDRVTAEADGLVGLPTGP